MSIQFKYGSYTHDEGECQVAISRTVKRSENGFRRGYTDRYTVTGRLHAATVAAISSKIRAMQNAYAVDGKSFGLVGTQHWVNASKAIVSVVEGPSFPDGAGAQYTTYRDFSVVIEAEYSGTAGDASNTPAFTETITVRGGGPRVVWIECLNGPPQKQITVEQTLCEITQDGTATSTIAPPAARPPLYPALLMEAPTYSRNNPQLVGGKRSEPYTVSWSYRFGAPTRIL